MKPSGSDVISLFTLKCTGVDEYYENTELESHLARRHPSKFYATHYGIWTSRFIHVLYMIPSTALSQQYERWLPQMKLKRMGQLGVGLFVRSDRRLGTTDTWWLIVLYFRSRELKMCQIGKYPTGKNCICRKVNQKSVQNLIMLALILASLLIQLNTKMHVLRVT